jgi:hypothetical protein
MSAEFIGIPLPLTIVEYAAPLNETSQRKLLPVPDGVDPVITWYELFPHAVL